jgi:hypothetical protein
MAECGIKLRHEGKSYPRTCSKCKLGPCQDGQDYAGLTARIRELEAQLAAPAVKVKPLDWQQVPIGNHYEWRAFCNLLVGYYHAASEDAKREQDAAREACILAAIEAVPVAEVWRRAMEAAAQVVECGCGEDEKARAVAAEAPNGGPRWMACGEANCGAIDAATIRALPMPDDLPPRQRL